MSTFVDGRETYMPVPASLHLNATGKQSVNKWEIPRLRSVDARGPADRKRWFAHWRHFHLQVKHVTVPSPSTIHASFRIGIPFYVIQVFVFTVITSYACRGRNGLHLHWNTLIQIHRWSMSPTHGVRFFPLRFCYLRRKWDIIIIIYHPSIITTITIIIIIHPSISSPSSSSLT